MQFNEFIEFAEKLWKNSNSKIRLVTERLYSGGEGCVLFDFLPQVTVGLCHSFFIRNLFIEKMKGHLEMENV